MTQIINLKLQHVSNAILDTPYTQGGINKEWIYCVCNKAIEIALAEQQAQPEPADPHAALRAEYIRQRDAVPCELGFYLWEFKSPFAIFWSEKIEEGEKCEPSWFKGSEYRYTDISCYVSKDGEPAVRMLRTEAQELQRQTKDTHDWSHYANTPAGDYVFTFDAGGTYNYRTKATIKLNGNMVTPEQAAAEWEAKKDTHQMHFQRSEGNPWFSVFDNRLPKDIEKYFSIDKNCKFELRAKAPKQVSWTGSRDDVIALLKVERLL